MMRDELAKYIEHTLLMPQAVEEDYARLCNEAVEHEFHGVCVPPGRVRLACSLLHGSDVRVVTVAGFPLGFSTTATKVFEAENALAEGAQELDMVINIGFLKEGRWAALEQEISSIVRCAVSGKEKPVIKVIIETCYLTDKEKGTAAQVIYNAGADFVKTSTGFGPQGASVEDMTLLCRAAPGLLIKAAGGIRTREHALALVKAGAARLGTSCGPGLVKIKNL